MPPSSRTHPDPFTTSTSAPSLRHQPSHPSLRSTAASSASSRRPHQQRDYLAPIARRPTGRSTPRIEPDVLADTDSSSDHAAKPLRRTPARPKKPAPEPEEFVNRNANGSYFLDGSLTPTTSAFPEEHEEMLARQAREEEAAVARRYFTSGEHLRGSGGFHRMVRRHTEEDDFEANKVDMLAVLREEAMQKIEEEKWLYEAMDRFA